MGTLDMDTGVLLSEPASHYDPRAFRGFALLLAALANCAYSQTVESQHDLAGEVIVTAQKRRQSIQDVGMSVAAFSKGSLESRGVESTEDLQRLVPGLTFTRTPAGPPVLTLRGVGFYDSTLAAAPAVSVYVDEAPLALPSFSEVGVIDIERVEVLKGPQGTLYGENSTGGAINYIAAKPTAELSTGASLSYGRFNTVAAEGFVSGPLQDTLKFRMALKTTQADDWQHSFTRNQSLGAIHRTAARAMLEWQPNAAATVSLTANGWTDTSDVQAFQYRATECTNPTLCAPELGNYPVAPDNARAADWTPGWPMSSDDRFVQTLLRADVALSERLNFTSVTGYQDFKQDKYLDQDATRIQNLDYRQRGTASSFNQELRLSGEASAAAWLVGAYFSTMNVDERSDIDVAQVSVNQPFPDLLPRGTTNAVRTGQDARSYAAFGNLEFRLTQHLSAIGGLRYTRSDRKFSGCTLSGSDPIIGQALAILSAGLRGVPPQMPPIGGCISLDRFTFEQGLTRDRLDQDNESFRVGLDYKTDSAVLFYGNVSKGYKSGSFPTLSASTSAQFLPVTQESVLAYEGGVKAPLPSQLGQVDASVFYSDYHQKQIRGRIADPVFGPLEALVNIPESRVFGFEGSIVVNPLTDLHLRASVACIDSKVRDFVGITSTGASENFGGSSFPYSPKWQAAADSEYSWSVNSAYRAFVGAGLTYHSSTHAALGEDPNFRLRSYVIADMRAGIETADNRWQLALIGENVTDQYYWNNVFQFIDTRFRIAALPATYAVRVSYNY